MSWCDRLASPRSQRQPRILDISLVSRHFLRGYTISDEVVCYLTVRGILIMKSAYLIMATALLVSFPAHLPAASEADPYSSYTLLYSSNVAGEIEPCG